MTPRRAWSAFSRWMRAGVTQRTLARLDDRQRADIGLPPRRARPVPPFPYP